MGRFGSITFRVRLNHRGSDSSNVSGVLRSGGCFIYSMSRTSIPERRDDNSMDGS